MQNSSETKDTFIQNFSLKAPIINILWDAAPLWGHLVLNAVIQTGLSYALIRSEDCKQGDIQAKILIVPGGSGRLKASKLGKKGIETVRKFVENGGTYIGFCGGAGLALTDENGGLGICPWGRNFYKNRMQHLVSGHIVSTLYDDELIPKNLAPSELACTQGIELPVWWPGKFQEPETEIARDSLQGPVRVLARYKDMGKDLHVADLPMQKLPASALEDWHTLYGVTLRPNLLDGQPAILTGTFGKGQYIISYSHLETPDSPVANEIFAHMLCTSLKNVDSYISDATSVAFDSKGKGLVKNILNTKPYLPTWINPYKESTSQSHWTILNEFYGKLEDLFRLGVDLHLLFFRTEWLYGWHNAVPGSQLNALRVALLRSLLLPSNARREKYMLEHGMHFAENMLLFITSAESWLLARRLSETLGEAGMIPLPILNAQKQELFGKHMAGGGLYGILLEWLDEFLFLES